MSVIGFDIIAGLVLYVVVMLWKIVDSLSDIASAARRFNPAKVDTIAAHIADVRRDVTALRTAQS
jgi:hypothetical protein